MDARIFIDVLKEREEIKEIEEKRNVRYEFHNILYYVKERYGLTIVNLAKVFETTRQTIYNYFKMKTDELPQKVKETLKKVYGVMDFDEVLNKELKVEEAYHFELPVLRKLSDDEGLIPVPDEYKEVFEPYQHPAGHFDLRPKRQYDFQTLWEKAIEGEMQPRLDAHQRGDERSAKLHDLFQQLMETHSEAYLSVLFKVIAKRIEADDEDFILHLMDYSKRK